jgi:tetratricopeptide (TPR) repeat protein
LAAADYNPNTRRRKATNRKALGVAAVVSISLAACASTVDQRGQKFDYKPNGIVIGETTKRQVLESYGSPTTSEVRGKYEILTYQYSKESLRHERTIGMSALSVIPVVGLATLAMDHSVQDSEISREGRVLKVYAELSSGVVRDYYYHDTDMKGHDESETLLLKGHALLKQGKTQEAIQAFEKAVALNPANHRVLNTLAWTLIDLNIDLEKAVRYAEEAVEVFPDSPYNNGTLGCGCFKKRDFEKAEKYLNVAVSLFPVYAPQDTKALAHDKAILAAVQEQKK